MVTTTTRVPKTITCSLIPTRRVIDGEKIKVYGRNGYLSPESTRKTDGAVAGPFWLPNTPELAQDLQDMIDEVDGLEGPSVAIKIERGRPRNNCPASGNLDADWFKGKEPDMSNARAWHFFWNVLEWGTEEPEGFISDPEPKPAGNTTSNEGKSLMGAIDEQENKGADYASKDSDAFVATSMNGNNNYSGGQSQDEFRRSKQEMRWTEAVHMAYVGAAEVDPDWTKIEANAHRIYAIIERGPQADILAQIEQDTQ